MSLTISPISAASVSVRAIGAGLERMARDAEVIARPVNVEPDVPAAEASAACSAAAPPEDAAGATIDLMMVHRAVLAQLRVLQTTDRMLRELIDR